MVKKNKVAPLSAGGTCLSSKHLQCLECAGQAMGMVAWATVRAGVLESLWLTWPMPENSCKVGEQMGTQDVSTTLRCQTSQPQRDHLLSISLLQSYLVIANVGLLVDNSSREGR